jgi:hypothetical protein
MVEVPTEGGSDARFDPQAVVVGLARSVSGPLFLAPAAETTRLVDLLNDPPRVFELFDRVGGGESLRSVAADFDLRYLTAVALFESNDPAVVALRKVVRAALAMEDRAVARSLVRGAITEAGNGTLEEGEKRLIDASLALAKVEEPQVQQQKVGVSVNVSLGDALVQQHKARRAPVTVEGTVEHGSDLGI